MEATILIVEDSLMYGKLLERTIENNMGFKTHWFQSYLETEEWLAAGNRATIALLDFILPDALDGEIIELCRKYGIPSVVITANLSDDLQEFAWSHQILDYVPKEGAHTLHYLMDLLDRFNRNPRTGILVVDDSKMARKHLTGILAPYRFKVYEAQDGLDALEVLEKHDEIKVVLTDYTMPRCDGFELTRRIRQNFPIDKLAIIGLSAKGGHQMAVKFIKYGANDFLGKPFISDMLIVRINQNLKLVEQFDSMREITLIDHLTNVNNRRYLFEAGDIIFEHARRTGDYPVVGMVDIDHFKTINDTYGHIVGDEVLAQLAQTLRMAMRKSDVLSRYGGEEFCLICRNMSAEMAGEIFDKWRRLIESLDFHDEDRSFKITVSIGVCTKPEDSFLAMVKKADELLYEAKSRGRNTVVSNAEKTEESSP